MERMHVLEANAAKIKINDVKNQVRGNVTWQVKQ